MILRKLNYYLRLKIDLFQLELNAPLIQQYDKCLNVLLNHL